jgi:hypothetical protein
LTAKLLTSLAFLLIAAFALSLPAHADTLTADSLEYDTAGVAHAKGHVNIESSTLFAGTTVTVECDEATFDQAGGKLEAVGHVEIEFSKQRVTLTGSRLDYDQAAGTGSLSDAKGRFPLVFSLKHWAEERTVMREEMGFLLKGAVTFKRVDGADMFVIDSAVFSSTPYEDSDFIVKVRKMTFVPEKYATLDHIAAYASGYRIAEYPKYTVKLKKGKGPAILTFPMVGYSSSAGVRLSSRGTMPLGALDLDTRLTYYSKLGFLPHGFLYKKIGDVRVGVEAGKERRTGLFKEQVVLTQKYNCLFLYDATSRVKPFKRISLVGESGRVEQDEPYVLTRRDHAGALVEMPDARLGKSYYFVSAAGADFFKYGVHPDSLRILTADAGFERRRKVGADRLVFYSHTRQGMTPIVPDINRYERELEFEVGGKIHPKWVGRIESLYEFDNTNFERLRFVATRLHRSYSLSFFFDSARHAGGVYIGLIGAGGELLEEEN